MAIIFFFTFVLKVPKGGQYFIITINEINGNEFSVILALNFTFLFVMPISEIFNVVDFRFYFFMVRF